MNAMANRPAQRAAGTGGAAPVPAWRARWQALAPREQSLVLAAAVLVGAALLWWLALAPALATLRTAEARHAALDAQLQRVLGLQAQARTLQAQPRANRYASVRALEAAVRERLGPNARVQLAGDRATVSLQDVPADALAAWMAQVRSAARAVPVEARLARAPVAAGSAAAGPRWSGSVVLSLPPA